MLYLSNKIAFNCISFSVQLNRSYDGGSDSGSGRESSDSVDF